MGSRYTDDQLDEINAKTTADPKDNAAVVLTRLCEFCGIALIVTIRQVERGRGRFCSVTCKNRASAIPLADRFFDRVGRKTERGCIIWVTSDVRNKDKACPHLGPVVYFEQKAVYSSTVHGICKEVPEAIAKFIANERGKAQVKA